MTLELMCAILNDNQRFVEKFEEIPGSLSDDLDDSEREVLEQQLQIYIKGFVGK